MTGVIERGYCGPINLINTQGKSIRSALRKCVKGKKNRKEKTLEKEEAMPTGTCFPIRARSWLAASCRGVRSRGWRRERAQFSPFSRTFKEEPGIEKTVSPEKVK